MAPRTVVHPPAHPASIRPLVHPNKYVCGLKDRYLSDNRNIFLGKITIPAKALHLTLLCSASCECETSDIFIFYSGLHSERECNSKTYVCVCVGGKGSWWERGGKCSSIFFPSHYLFGVT